MSEPGENEILRANTEKTIQVRERVPKVVDIAHDSDRNNQLRSVEVSPITFKQSERPAFTEKEGLEDLVGFLDLTFQTAQAVGDNEMAEKVRLFKENVGFVGEKELKEATQGIARHLVDEAKEGKDVIVYVANVRSERYVALRVMEEMDSLTEELVELRKRIKVSESPKIIARNCKDALGNCLIAVTDDFVVSGTRIQDSATRMYRALLQEGFSQAEAASLIEADVVAIPQRREGNSLSVGVGEGKADLRVFSYYGVPEYRDANDKWVVFTGVSISSSHSSTDYGFGQVLEELGEFLRRNGVERDFPLLHRIIRPYEIGEGSKYEDPALQARWEKIIEKYGIKL